MTKTAILTLLLGVAMLSPALATPLDKARISADAKWLIHLDLDRSKETVIGSFLMEKYLVSQTAKTREDLKREFGFDLDWRKVRSVTAYGTTYEPNDPGGLLLIESDLPVQDLLSKALEKNLQSLKVEKLAGSPNPLYRVNGLLFASMEKSRLLVLSRSKWSVEHSQAVLAGTKPSLTATDPLKHYPDVPFSFGLLALADDFARQAPLPVKAAVLKQAEGGRLAIGEEGGKVRLQLDLRTQSPEVATQVRQVAEGLVGLAALQAAQNPDLKVLADALKISAQGPLVTLDLRLPSAQIIDKIGSKRGKSAK